MPYRASRCVGRAIRLASPYTERMMEHDYRHLSTEFDMDAWLDAADDLAAGNHSANDVPATRPFVHMTGPAGELLLRQWPEGATVQHVKAIAIALNAMHEAVGDAIPAVRSDENGAVITTTVKGRLYTSQTWLEGRPLGRFGGHRTPDGETISLPLPESAHADAVIGEVARIIAQCHSATDGLNVGDLPTFTIAQLMERVRKYWFDARKILGDKAADERDIRRWLRCGNRMVPTASDLLRNERGEMHDTSVVLHRDLWPENVLISGVEDDRSVTGIVGWRHMAKGSPVMDIAQMCACMQGWSAALTEGVIEQYAITRHLRPDQRRMVPAVAGMMLVETVGQLLTWSYLDQRMFGHQATPVIRSGMKTMLDSLERLTHILAPDIERTERINRARREGDGGGWQRTNRVRPPMRPGGKPRTRSSQTRRKPQ